jgi:hypothetical protein
VIVWITTETRNIIRSLIHVFLDKPSETKKVYLSGINREVTSSPLVLVLQHLNCGYKKDSRPRSIQMIHFDTKRYSKSFEMFRISNFRPALNVVCFLLGNSPASEFYMPTFRNTLFHLRRRVGMKNVELILHTHLPMKMEQTECSETSSYKIQTPRNNPEESIQHLQHDESLKSRI